MLQYMMNSYYVIEILMVPQPKTPSLGGSGWYYIKVESISIPLQYSCRSASTSKATATGISLDRILKAAQWSTSSTFYQFYRKDIMVTAHLVDNEFACALLPQTPAP